MPGSVETVIATDMATDLKEILQLKLQTLADRPYNEMEPIITEILTLMSTSSCHSSLRQLGDDLPLSLLFDVVFSIPNPSQENCQFLELFTKLLSYTTPDVLVTRFYNELIKCLCHSHPEVQNVALSQVVRCSKDPSAAAEMMSKTELLTCIIECLAIEDINIAQNASTVLKNLGKDIQALHVFISQPVKDAIDGVLQQGDIPRLRMLELLAILACSSYEALLIVSRSAFLDVLLNELNGTDILVKLNCLELLSQLVETKHGLLYLEEMGVLLKMKNILLNQAEDPLGDFLTPGLLKFFGSVGSHKPRKVCKEYEGILDLIFQLIQGNSSCRVVAIDTLGVLGKSAEGKRTLSDEGEKMINCLKVIGDYIESAVVDLRIRSLNCIRNLLHVE
ncbi:26S proteasome non-ATPase regulatory subunit 5 isoform X2 [Tachypleus tridentatus]